MIVIMRKTQEISEPCVTLTGTGTGIETSEAHVTGSRGMTGIAGLKEIVSSLGEMWTTVEWSVVFAVFFPSCSMLFRKKNEIKEFYTRGFFFPLQNATDFSNSSNQLI